MLKKVSKKWKEYGDKDGQWMKRARREMFWVSDLEERKEKWAKQNGYENASWKIFLHMYGFKVKMHLLHTNYRVYVKNTVTLHVNPFERVNYFLALCKFHPLMTETEALSAEAVLKFEDKIISGPIVLPPPSILSEPPLTSSVENPPFDSLEGEEETEFKGFVDNDKRTLWEVGVRNNTRLCYYSRQAITYLD